MINIECNAQIPTYVPTNGLVGWWPFTGNANDESGNGNNGTVNGATLTADRFGQSNRAYSFDGVNDNINPLKNNLPIGTTARSVSVWFQRIGSGGCLFSYGTANTGNAYNMISVDWHKGCNWSPAKVPACCNSVIVPLTSNQPIVTGVAGCKDITIHSTNGARLQVNTGANLQIEQCPSPPIRNGYN